jgi:hypothetical protein
MSASNKDVDIYIKPGKPGTTGHSMHALAMAGIKFDGHHFLEKP